jgi:hypothetical protein
VPKMFQIIFCGNVSALISISCVIALCAISLIANSPNLG